MAINYNVLCKKCKKYFSKKDVSKIGYCKECRVIPGKCKFISEKGYSCDNSSDFLGYCMEHFLRTPFNKIKEQIKVSTKDL